MLAAALIIHHAGCTPAPRYFGKGNVTRKEIERVTERGARQPGQAITFRHPLLNLAPDRINSPFGLRIHPVYGTRDFHSGVDFKAATGDGVYAVADGTVKFSGRQRRYGKIVIIEHAGDVSSVYAHLSETAVKHGEHVAGGRRIGSVGASGNATGTHLHFEIRISGAAVDPLEHLVLR